ncbi:Csa-PIP kinase-like protein [Dinothrombium tinctorium]|uniref:1-phosphatidylinositol-3-phosphate 5-kinase n=2 Tax=Dinothrombium tinctorium TaxID=1965070 RepID=A0A3S3PKY4_9ACAR|nr:Csa-PIP kinase-like protein [Dinothrombium tinctorium]RWS03450.1 Csa-PIP kinase-like protein [Dinothrombium tinctorium]
MEQKMSAIPSREAIADYLDAEYNELSRKMTFQLLSDEKITDAWLNVIKNISSRVALKVDPSNFSSEHMRMDVRRFVKIKTIVGGNKTDSNIIGGVVFSKNVVHRKMRQNIVEPKILLLACPLIYEQQNYTTFDSIMQFERNYLQSVVNRIAEYNPDIVVVHQTVARKAQEMLLDAGITLVTNVKEAVLERLAMFTGAEIVRSLDFQRYPPQLGVCNKFYLQTFNSKTLMYFDGCPHNFGCSVILRGSLSKKELKKIKEICSFLIFCDYNWRLEKSFLMDICAVPKSLLKIPTQEISSNSINSIEETKEKEECFTNSTERKVEPVTVEDNSDPLRSMAEKANMVCVNAISPLTTKVDKSVKHDENKISLANLIRKAVLLSSPFIELQLPYLLSVESENCLLKKYIAMDNLYWTKRISLLDDIAFDESRLTVEDSTGLKEETLLNGTFNVELKHPFYTRKLTETLTNSHDIQSLLADFRARGGMSFCGNVNSEKISKNEEVTEPFRDALHPKFHQRLPVLYCSYTYSSQTPFCDNPSIVDMEFYNHCDIALGAFLEKFCFSPSYTCPVSGCNIAMTEHTRKFIHNSGLVQILLKGIKSSINAAEENIITWSWCQECKASSPSFPLSPDSWSLSFAKFLELKIYGNKYVRRLSEELSSCTKHSLFNDSVQYFAYKQMVASFKYVPIVLREIVLPPPKIRLKIDALPVSSLTDELKSITIKGYDVLSSILGIICKLKEECVNTKYEAKLNEFMIAETNDRLAFRKKIDDNHMELSNHPDAFQRLSIENTLVLLLKFLWDLIQTWNAKFQEFVSNKKKEEKTTKFGTQIPQISQASTNKLQIPIPDFDQVSVSSSTTMVTNSMNEEAEEVLEQQPLSFEASISNYEEPLESGEEISNNCDQASTPVDCGSLKACLAEQQEECQSKLEELNQIIIEAPPDESNESTFEKISSSSSISSITYGVTPGINAVLDKSEELSCDLDAYAVVHHTSVPVSSVEECVNDENVYKKNSDETDSLNSLTAASDQNRSNVTNPTEVQKTSMKTIINQLLSNAANSFVESPFDVNEHFLPSMRDKLPIIIRDNDPGSIIAFTLASAEYEKQLSELLRTAASPNIKKKHVPSDVSDTKDNEISLGSTATSFNSSKATNSSSQEMHIDLQFNDVTCKLHCHVYFAEQFRRLRAEIIEVDIGSPPGNSTPMSYSAGSHATEAMFIRSISRSIPWTARGGKSKSNFFKSIDDRFILKEMTSTEFQSFLSMAKSYFDYVTNSISESKPTLLAKIVGVYKISFKNILNNSASKLYILVLENIFYRRNISQKFDLKGSVRNRMASTNTPDEVVLLDENLIKMTRESPFYIRNHSKRVLQAAIGNDSSFLASLSLMDYSLLVGIDEDCKEFIVGIIDYIRNFTWDKKLEMMVKSVGAHGKTPTIVAPDVYRERFCERMDQYFLYVPDKWHQLEAGDNDCFPLFSYTSFN